METKIVKLDINLDEEELWDLFWAISHNIEHDLDTHWINFATEPTEEEFVEKVLHHEASLFTFLNTFANILDRRDLIVNIDYMIKETYKKAQEKKKAQ